MAGGVRGLWGFVKDGMGGITHALAASARSRGAEILTETRVASIKIRNGRATGVVLSTGEEIEGKAVVSGVDPRRTFLEW